MTRLLSATALPSRVLASYCSSSVVGSSFCTRKALQASLPFPLSLLLCSLRCSSSLVSISGDTGLVLPPQRQEVGHQTSTNPHTLPTTPHTALRAPRTDSGCSTGAHREGLKSFSWLCQTPLIAHHLYYTLATTRAPTHRFSFRHNAVGGPQPHEIPLPSVSQSSDSPLSSANSPPS